MVVQLPGEGTARTTQAASVVQAAVPASAFAATSGELLGRFTGQARWFGLAALVLAVGLGVTGLALWHPGTAAPNTGTQAGTAATSAALTTSTEALNCLSRPAVVPLYTLPFQVHLDGSRIVPGAQATSWIYPLQRTSQTPAASAWRPCG